MDLATLATLFSGVSFLGFGVSCFVSPYMKREFVRYGYARQRPVTGALQVLGGAGLLLGWWMAWPLLAAAAATGLCLMMSYGVGIRIYIGDTFLQTVPALGYALLNLYLAIHYGTGR